MAEIRRWPASQRRLQAEPVRIMSCPWLRHEITLRVASIPVCASRLTSVLLSEFRSSDLWGVPAKLFGRFSSARGDLGNEAIIGKA